MTFLKWRQFTCRYSDGYASNKSCSLKFSLWNFYELHGCGFGRKDVDEVINSILTYVFSIYARFKIGSEPILERPIKKKTKKYIYHRSESFDYRTLH